MAGHPLRSATDRRLGGPLPRQPANRTRAHPVPPEFSAAGHAARGAHAVLAAVSGRCPPVRGRLPTRYSPVRHSVARASGPKTLGPRASFDLHVLGTPPAFILSQDQTLMLKRGSIPPEFWRSPSTPKGIPLFGIVLANKKSRESFKVFHCSVLKVRAASRCFTLCDSHDRITCFLSPVNCFFTVFYKYFYKYIVTG